MRLREVINNLQEEAWTSHKELANILYKHTGNKQLAIDFFHLETEFDSQDDMQSTGLSALDMNPFDSDRERVNRILSINNVPVKVLKMKHNDAYETLYSLLQSAPVNEDQYKSNSFADIKDMLAQQRADQQKQKRYDNYKSYKPGDKTFGKGGAQNKYGGSPSTQQAKNSNFPGTVSKEPQAQQLSRLNNQVTKLFQQGMAPPEIEEYLVYTLKVKPAVAKKLIDQELYEPASRVVMRNPIGNDIYKSPYDTRSKQPTNNWKSKPEPDTE